jgi:cell wall-associated NlpC family hydrolase
MKMLLAVTVAILGATAVTSAYGAGACDSFTTAVDSCATANTRCEHFQCVAKRCPTAVAMRTANRVCRAPDAASAVWGRKGSDATASRGKPDGDDRRGRKHVALPRKNAQAQTGSVPLPTVNSPCLGIVATWTREDIQSHMYATAFDIYNERANETYSEDAVPRWDGINDHICPPLVPMYSDCSSTVTWIYWTLFGNGPDFLSQMNWTNGWTGSLNQHGVAVAPANASTLQIGDLCFYYFPMHHVAMYVGNGMVVSHGMDPVGYYPYDYAPIDYCRRYL